MAARLGLGGRITFLGRLPPQDMAARFAEADAFVFTSLRDSLGSVTLEAMSRGVPLITLDHQGQRALIPAEAAFKVPASDPATAIDSFTTAIRRLAAAPEECERLSRAGRTFAATLRWDRRAQDMSHLYRQLLATLEGRSSPRAKTVADRAVHDLDHRTAP